MKIFDINEMENIVNNNSSLSWLGWNVVFTEEDPVAYMNKDAKFKDDRWYKTILIENTDGHWKIPGSVVKKINV